MEFKTISSWSAGVSPAFSPMVDLRSIRVIPVIRR